MRKNYLKPEIETAPLLLNVGIMSATGDNTTPTDPSYVGPPQQAPRKKPF